MDSELSKKIEGVFLGRKRVDLTLKVDRKNDPKPIVKGFKTIYRRKLQLLCDFLVKILLFESRKAVIEDDEPFLPKNHRKRKPTNRDIPSTSATIVLSSGESDDETENKKDSRAEDAELQYLLRELVNFF